jgi:ribosomal protein S18 acetylase RimI-like enzyme
MSGSIHEDRSSRNALSALGARSVELHVFGHNHRARALYEKVGFNETSITMAKPIHPEQG